ncbi:MAG: nitroreductase [Clostridia bacterium]|nr:nitroreductase [Clostridia bacterium]
MDIFDAMKHRHSVRAYSDRRIEDDIVKKLNKRIAEINSKSGLNIQLVTEDPEAFGGMIAHYGGFSGVRNYIALIAKKGAEWEEKIGYYGEMLTLEAEMLDLNTCWVAMSYSKGKAAGKTKIAKGEKLHIALTLGYGAVSGKPHKSKPIDAVAEYSGDAPLWFREGIKAALLAHTAMNQQKFKFVLSGNTVKAIAGRGFYTAIDLGIVKYHFELGAGKENFSWD